MRTDLLEQNRRILIIDDNPAIHADFRKILAGTGGTSELAQAETDLFGSSAKSEEGPGFELTSAHQGQEALGIVQEAIQSGRPFAMAFVDVRMPPGWDGIETTARLWEADPDLQIVICTAYSDYSWDDMRRRLGAPDRLLILKKPFDMIEVLQLATALTEKWRLTQQAGQRLEDLEEMVQHRTEELRAANEALLRDLDERQRAKAKLAESEFSLRESQRVGRVGSYILDIPTGGWTSSVILDDIFDINQHYAKTLAGWSALLHPEDRENIVAYLAEVFAQKKRFEKDYRIIRQNDGEERWVFGLGELILDDFGNPVKMIGVIQDITERKNSEQRIVAFSNLGQRLSSAKTAKEAGKIIVGVADESLGWDACSFALYSPDEDRVEDSINYDTIDGQRVEIQATCSNSTPSALARRVIVEGGQLILKENPEEMVAGSAPFGNVARPSVSILFVPVLDDSKVIGLLSIHSYTPNAYDQRSLAELQSLADHCGGALTRIQAEEARARLEDQFRQMQKMEAVGQLAGGVAHDFNNIMAAVLMHLGLLRTEESLAPQVISSLHELEREVQRGARLTRQLLMFSRRQVMQMKSLDLNQVVLDMLKMLQRLLGEHIEVVFDSSNTPVVVGADAGMMEQVVMNLSVNGRDAMPRGGRLTITTRPVEISAESSKANPEARPGSFICLSVTDAGCGMDNITRQRIFEPFFTTKEIGKGTGLGLATVHGIAKQHQGWLEVESEVGKGSTFRMFLPALPQSPPDDRPTITAEIRGGNETILLVEDEPSVRNVAARTLKHYGYHVLEAVNGREALQHWEQHKGKIDLLFSDVIMPEGMTGLELAKRLKETKPSLKIIVSSGYSPDLAGKDTAFFRRSKSHFLQKPYPSRVLIDTVRRCLDEA